MKKLLSISFIVVILDQLIKIIVSKTIPLYSSLKIIDNFFYLTYVQNKGAAWSILTGSRWLLIILGIITITIIYIFFIKNKKLKNIEIIIYGLLIGGIIGNLIDRIIYGYVIDYLDFYLFNYNYPVFNLADICIVIATIILVLLTFKGEKYDNSRS